MAAIAQTQGHPMFRVVADDLLGSSSESLGGDSSTSSSESVGESSAQASFEAASEASSISPESVESSSSESSQCSKRRQPPPGAHTAQLTDEELGAIPKGHELGDS